MALNKVDASNGRLTLQGDYVIHHEEKIDFSLEGDRIPDFMKGTHKGDIFITNMRVIFINSKGSGYKSFSMDFQFIRNTEVKQPIFGANYLAGFIIAEPNGGWEGNANFKIIFSKGGAIEFAEKFSKAVKEATRIRQSGGVAPPPPGGMYMPPNGMMPPPPGMYPPPGGYYPPPPTGAYYPPPGGAPPMAYGYQAQPPPGAQPLYGNAPNQPPPPYQDQSFHPPNNSKAQEAYMTTSTNNVYIPNQEPPPPYAPGSDKKNE